MKNTEEPDAVYKNTRSKAKKGKKPPVGAKGGNDDPCPDAGWAAGMTPTLDPVTNEWIHPGMAPYNEVHDENAPHGNRQDSSDPGSREAEESSEDEDLADY